MRGDHPMTITAEYLEYVQLILLISREYRCAAEFLSGTFIRSYVTGRIKLSNRSRNVEEYRAKRTIRAIPHSNSTGHGTPDLFYATGYSRRM